MHDQSSAFGLALLGVVWELVWGHGYPLVQKVHRLNQSERVISLSSVSCIQKMITQKAELQSRVENRKHKYNFFLVYSLESLQPPLK